MPGWLQAFVKANPVTSAIDAARGLMLGGPVAEPGDRVAHLDGGDHGGVRTAGDRALPAPGLTGKRAEAPQARQRGGVSASAVARNR